MMEVRCEGIVRAHSILMCLEDLPLSTPESTNYLIGSYYGIEQPVLMYSYSQMYTKNQTKLWTSSHIQFCCAVCFCLDFTIMPQGLLFSWLPEFGFSVNAASLVGHEALKVFVERALAW